MLLSLSQWLLVQFPEWGFLRVFQYLTFRAVMSAMTALLIGLSMGPWVIKKLTELRISTPPIVGVPRLTRCDCRP